MSFDPITYGGGPPKEQLWKVNDRKAQKNGMNRAIFGVKTHVIKDTIKRRNVKAMEKTWDIGNIYQGEWKNNQKHGYGIQVWAVGNKYEGDWANGLCEGHGIFWVKHKEELRKVYAGNWKAGLKCGLGVQYYKTGDRYEGEWSNGVREGRGTLFLKNGDVYVGDWKDDKQSGFGTITRSNNDVYEGEWLNGLREGAGIHYFKNKEKVYDGEWVMDQPKCGVYLDAADFFNPDELDPLYRRSLRFPTAKARFDEQGRRVRPIPAIGLDSADLLSERIAAIQDERSSARSLPYVQLEVLFSDEVLDRLRAVFCKMDTELEGKVLVIHLKDMLETLGLVCTDKQLAQICLDLNLSAKSTFTFSEVVKAVHLARQFNTAAAGVLGATTDAMSSPFSAGTKSTTTKQDVFRPLDIK